MDQTSPKSYVTDDCDMSICSSISGMVDDVSQLKLAKSRAKAQFTISLHQLMEFFDDAEIVSRPGIRSKQALLADAVDRVMDVLDTLAGRYRSSGDQDNVDKIREEMDVIESQFSSAMSTAQRVLDGQSPQTRKSEQVTIHTELNGSVSPPPVAGHSTPNVNHLRPTAQEFQPQSTFTPNRINTSTGNSWAPMANNTIGQDLWRQLKRVSIPIFDGDKRKYEAWKAAFVGCVDSAPMSSEFKLLQLRQYLSGEALKAIENLGHSAASYEAAKERLDRKFGGTRRQLALQMEQIDCLKPLRHGDAKDLEKFADLLDLTVINMKEAGQIDELGCGALYHKLLRKLNETLVASYQRWVFEHHKPENVETLREFINRESEFQTIASETVQGLAHVSVTHHRKSGIQSFFGRHTGEKPEQLSCQRCGDRHGIWKCETFKQMSVPDRWKFAKEKQLCFRCLGSFHTGATCKRSRVCGINACTKVHHRLLHSSEDARNRINAHSVVSIRPTANGDAASISDNVESRNVTMMSSEKCVSAIALRTVPVILVNGRKSLKVNALLDDGSTKTYLNADVAAELGLVGEPQHVSVSVLNGQKKVFDTYAVNFCLCSLDGAVSSQISAFTTEKVTGDMVVVDWEKCSKKWPHLSKIEFPKIGVNQKVDILIGLDNADMHVAEREIRGKPGEPIARLTPLGWTCVGSTVPGGSDIRTNFVHTYFVQQIDETLRKFWEVESCTSSDQLLSPSDRAVIESTTSSMKYSSSEQRYQVGIPWKQDPTELPCNYELAIRRLEGTEKRLVRDPTVATAYCATIQQYLSKGYIQQVEAVDRSENQWYLPHFAVIRPDKSTTKTRIVFDASATYKNTSLNSVISQGPKLQRELVDVLLRFRRNPVALVCDISEMYLQVEIAPEDRRFFRFLWRNLDTGRPPEVYEFNRVVFGVNCSPFLAQFVAQEHARKYSVEFPAAAETVLKSTYMDDSMDSVLTSREGIGLYTQLSALWKLAGMTTRKWLSNSEEVLCNIPCEDQATEVEIDGGQLYGTKTLGVLWLAQQDVFTFRFKPPKSDFVYTKRTVLQKVAALFDPLGFLAPYIIRAKILLQKLWASGADWDDPLGAELRAEACQWFTELADIERIYVPRCLRLCNAAELISSELHVFADASGDAYGTVAYVRCTYKTGEISCHFVCAKTKVGPLQAVSIPRLELMASMLALRLGQCIATALEFDLSTVTFWSDSMNVLCWIRNRSRIYKPFVANRIGEIQNVTSPDQWKYVPTKQNPADVASRGVSVANLVCHPLWWNGPDFLMELPSEWPKQPSNNIGEVTAEVKKSARDAVTFLVSSCSTVGTVQLIDEHRYSSWFRMLRVHSWMLRFIHNCLSSEQNRLSGELNSDEFRDSEIVIIKACQQQAFPDEYKALVQKKSLSCGSKLLVLNPCLDEDGLIRSNSRLVNADSLSHDARYPIILPRRHGVTRLIVKFAHETGLHVSGTNGTLFELSQKYWIIAAREAIREWEQSCMTCKRRAAKAATQLMAPLPSSRVKIPRSLRAFTHTAVDFAGPFVTIQGRGRSRVKRYLCLFTCMNTRAVHLEMAYGLDTDSFLKAFYRFTDRRGYPEQITSDNGGNFVGANRELQELVSKLNQRQIVKSTGIHCLKWNFNPPLASHFGGVFEIMIKAAKRAIYAILANAEVTDEELTSAFIGAEALLNSRPLTYQSASPTDIIPLTPSHFLHGELGRRTAPAAMDEDRHPRTRWRRVQEVIRHFWHRWMKEWLPSLAARKKWTTSSRNFAVGDVVLVINSQTVRGHWPLGRIVAVHPGQDGRVRVVDVKIGDTVFVRSVTTLCPLEFADN